MIFTYQPYSAPVLERLISKRIRLAHGSRRRLFVAENLNVPAAGRDPPLDQPEPLASDPPAKPLHDLPGDPKDESRQAPTDPTPNAASGQLRELPSGVLWC
jgi:hypothetical protein